MSILTSVSHLICLFFLINITQNSNDRGDGGIVNEAIKIMMVGYVKVVLSEPENIKKFYDFNYIQVVN